MQVRSRAPISRCRLAARAAGLHPATTGVRVPPPRPLPGSSTVERPPVKRRDVGANPTSAAIFVGETASDVTCPTCRHCSEHHRGRRPSCVNSVRGENAPTAEAPRSKALKTERTTTMNAVALAIAWCALHASPIARASRSANDRKPPRPGARVPGRFNFHIRVWCQTVGDSPRKGDHAGASPVTLTNFVAVSSNQQDSGL